MTFPWGKYTSNANGGAPSYVADGADEFTSSGWTSEGFQSGSSGTNWIQVTLPSLAVCKDAAVIGYPGCSHMPTGTNNAWVKASVDGSNWVDAARWTTHPGCLGAYCCVAADGGDLGITKVSNDYDTYKIVLYDWVTNTPFQHWRVGGDEWTNDHVVAAGLEPMKSTSQRLC